jgi:hypothetical protein
MRLSSRMALFSCFLPPFSNSLPCAKKMRDFAFDHVSRWLLIAAEIDLLNPVISV